MIRRHISEVAVLTGILLPMAIGSFQLGRLQGACGTVKCAQVLSGGVFDGATFYQPLGSSIGRPMNMDNGTGVSTCYEWDPRGFAKWSGGTVNGCSFPTTYYAASYDGSSTYLG
jgi:hypothetical protein